MNCKEKLTQVLRANYKRNYTMQETSLLTTKDAQCPKCGKYHALIAIEMCNKYRKAERKFYSDAMARGFEVVDTTTKDAKDNFADDCLKPKTLF